MKLNIDILLYPVKTCAIHTDYHIYIEDSNAITIETMFINQISQNLCNMCSFTFFLSEYTFLLRSTFNMADLMTDPYEQIYAAPLGLVEKLTREWHKKVVSVTDKNNKRKAYCWNPIDKVWEVETGGYLSRKVRITWWDLQVS